eukprot:6040895-Pyramimonas_sp.AAC.1
MAMLYSGALRRSQLTQASTLTDGSRRAALNARDSLKQNRENGVLWPEDPGPNTDLLRSIGIDMPRPAPTYIAAAAAPSSMGQLDEDALKDFQTWCAEACTTDKETGSSHGRPSRTDGESDWDRAAIDCAAATRRRGVPRVPLRGRHAGHDARREKGPAYRPCYYPLTDSMQTGEREATLALPSESLDSKIRRYACVARPVTKAEAADSEKAQKALMGEWGRLENIKTWDESKVQELRDVKAKMKGKPFTSGGCLRS